jgi:hypothetical protein
MPRKKQAGIPGATEKSAPRPENVVNLMDALRRSIQEEQRSAPARKGRKRVEDSGRCCFLFLARGGRWLPLAKPLLGLLRGRRKPADCATNHDICKTRL